MSEAKKPWVQRAAIFFYALVSASLVTISIGGLFSTSVVPVLIFAGSFVSSLFVWYWVLFQRPAELRKKLPIRGKELRRRNKEFYDSLPR